MGTSTRCVSSLEAPSASQRDLARCITPRLCSNLHEQLFDLSFNILIYKSVFSLQKNGRLFLLDLVWFPVGKTSWTA